MSLPGIASWSRMAGGTGAAPGKYGYDHRTAKQTYTISPHTTQYGRHAGYLLTVYPGDPAHGHQRLGNFRSPQAAVSAAKKWASQHDSTQTNPRARKTRDYWAIEGYYAGGWEEVTEESTWREARQRLKEYRENERGTAFRARRRREKLGQATNPSVRVGKFKGRTTHPGGGPITLRQQFSAKAYVGRKKTSRPRYLVGFGQGSTGDYINAKKLSTAKVKGEAHAKKRGFGSFWVQNQVTGSMLQFKVVPRGRSQNPGGPLDTHAAKELELFVENDSDLYRQQYTPINKNLITKMAKGVYNHDKAVKLFGYLMESGAKKYARQYGSGQGDWHQIFSPATRKAAAEVFTRSFEVEAKLGNYDNLLPKKYSDWRLKKNPGRMCDVLVRRNGQTFKAKAKYDVGAKRVRIFVNPRVAKLAGVNPEGKIRLTPEQKKALKDYNFALSQEDRYLGSVFVTPTGQRRVEEKTKEAYDRAKRLGMDWRHGL